MWWMFIAAAVAEPVRLAPELPAGRAIHWTLDQRFDEGSPAQARAVWEVLSVDGDAVELKSTVRAPNPFPVFALVWPELVSDATARLVPGEVSAEVGGPMTPEDAAFGTCAALPGLWVLLPRAPVEPGASWKVGAMSCQLDAVTDAAATVGCAGERSLPGRTERVTRTLVVDREHGLITRCEARLEHDAGDPQRSWAADEVAVGSLGGPDPGGLGCSRAAGGGLVLLVLLVGGLVARQRLARPTG